MREDIVLSSDLGSTPYATTFVREFLCRNGVSCVDKFSIVVDEIFSNIANYAYKDGKGSVKVVCDYDVPSKIFSMTFIDSGVEYNPLNAPEPDVKLPLEKRRIGGLGIFIVKKFMDKLVYRRKGNENILTLVKKV